MSKPSLPAKERPRLIKPHMLAEPAELHDYFEVEHRLNLWPPFTSWLLALQTIVFLWSSYTYIMNPTDNLIIEGQFQGHWLTAGGWIRLVTAAFLHAGLAHYAGNMMLLYIAGVMVEHLYGLRYTALAALIILLAQGVASFVHYDNATATVGASGVVFGFMGWLAIFYVRYRKEIFLRYRTVGWVFLILSLHAIWQGLISDMINNAAHVGGFVSGVACGLIMKPLFDRGALDDFDAPKPLTQTQRWAQKAILATLTVLALGPFAWMQTKLTPHGNLDFWEQLANARDLLFSPQGVKAPEVTLWTYTPRQVEAPADPESQESEAPTSGSQKDAKDSATKDPVDDGAKDSADASAPPIRPPPSNEDGIVSADEFDKQKQDWEAEQGVGCNVCDRDSGKACECKPGCRWTYFHHFADKECRIKLTTTVWGPNTGSPFKMGFDTAVCVPFMNRYYRWEYPRENCFAPKTASEISN